MTISKYFFLFLLVLLDLSTCTSCHDEEVWTTLPPETQKGANTFGCYVNGELFVGSIRGFVFLPAGIPPLLAIFDHNTNRLHISCDSYSEGAGYMDLDIENPLENEYRALMLGYFTPGGIRDCDGFGCDNCGKVLITKFDTINRIVSGTFEFSGKCSKLTSDESGETKILFTGDSIVQVTDGRFDIKLNIKY